MSVLIQSEVMEAREKGHQAQLAEAETKRENKHLKDQVNHTNYIALTLVYFSKTHTEIFTRSGVDKAEHDCNVKH